MDYLGLSEKQLVRAAEKMAADGKYELAASLLESSNARFGHTESIAKAERLVYLKLMEKYQNTDPFKYILYSAKIGEQTPAMATANDHPTRPESPCGTFFFVPGLKPRLAHWLEIPVYSELLIRQATGHATLLHRFLYVIDSKRALSFGEAQLSHVRNTASRLVR